MNSVSAAIIFVGIAILALAVIALAIWVAALSARVRRISDITMFEASMHTGIYGAGSMNAAAAEYDSEYDDEDDAVDAAGRHAAPAPVSVAPVSQSTQAFTPQPVPINQPTKGSPRARQVAAGATGGTGSSPLIRTMHGGNPDDTNFFDTYRNLSDGGGKTEGMRGRAKPSIPFGDDKKDQVRRQEYTKDALSNDFDPDSIDFSRVAGYKNLNR